MLENIFKKIGITKKENCNSSFSNHHSSYTPTYLLIARDLESPQDAVFEAAVYYLCAIAAHKTNEKEPILKILNSTFHQKHLKTSRREYIEKLARLNNFFEVIHN